MDLKKHIIFFGYANSSYEVVKEIRCFNEVLDVKRQIVIISKVFDVPKFDNVIHINQNYFDSSIIHNDSLCIEECYACIVFSEKQQNELPSAVDIKTILTVYNIKKHFPDTYVLAEIIDHNNTGIINNTGCDAVLYKEEIDAELIINCIKYPMISKMIYELLSFEGKKIFEITINELNMGEKTVFKNIRKYGMENDVTFLGYINKDKVSILAPSNSEIITADDILIYVE